MWDRKIKVTAANHNGGQPKRRPTITAAIGSLLRIPLAAVQDGRPSGWLKLGIAAFLIGTARAAPAAVTPNDPLYPGQWALTQIGANYAWSITTGSPTVIIAVIDSGVTPVSDLAANMIPGWNFYANNSNTADVSSHGTFMASVAAAVTNNATGIAGVCWSCKIMPLLVSDTDGDDYAFAAVNALTYAANNGAKVAIIGANLAASPTVQQAALNFFNKGGVVLLPIGQGPFDDTPMPVVPGTQTPYMLAVGGTDQNNNRFSWSSGGYDLSLAAPGEVSAATSTDGFYTVIAEDTAYSAALVGGVAALMFSVNPCLSSTQITNILTQTATHLGTSGWNYSYGWGLVNAQAAVAAAASTSCSTSPTYSPCDVNQDGQTNVADVQADINAALGVIPCTSVSPASYSIYDINHDGQCNIIDVQRVTNAALGGSCVSP